MKKIFNLAANLRALFSALRLLMTIAGVLWGLLIVVEILSPGRLRSLHLVLDDAALQMADGAFSIKTESSGANDIQLERLPVVLKLNLFSTDPALASAVRWTLFPRFTAVLVFSWFLSTMIRDFCARIERGDVISEANLRSVRNIGLAIVSYNLANFALKFWTSLRLGSYLEQHARLAGINATFHASARQLYSLTTNDLVTGFLILLLAEAFRQGLALKQENDLTV